MYIVCKLTPVSLLNWMLVVDMGAAANDVYTSRTDFLEYLRAFMVHICNINQDELAIEF